MTKVTILGPLGSGGFDVHAVGCADIYKVRYRPYRSGAWDTEEESKRSLVLNLFSDFLGESYETEDELYDYEESEVKLYPCTGLKVRGGEMIFPRWPYQLAVIADYPGGKP